jgi:hypothetical protein
VSALLPACLDDAGEVTQEGQLSKTNPTQAKLSHVRAGSTALQAPIVLLHCVSGRTPRLDDHRFLSQSFSLLSERHAQQLEQAFSFSIRLSCRHNRYLQPAHTVDLVVVDLWKHQLLF